MNQAWTKEKYETTLKQLYQRAATDPAFRKRCLENAAAAIKEISGLELTDSRVRFVEKLEEQVLVLPALVTGGELNEQQLEMVAAAGAVCSWTAAKTTGTTIKKGDPMPPHK
jgi:hypothetical protein